MSRPRDRRAWSARRLAAAAVVVLGGVAWVDARTGAGDSPGLSGSPTPTSDGAPAPRCETPAAPLLDWAADAVASHPGPIISATMTLAATTESGTWYVIGIDRGYAFDDGSPTGDGSRSFALTNSTGTCDGVTDGSTRMIPLGQGTWVDDVELDWSRVSWRGETLEAGHRAARAAGDCLDRLRSELPD